MRTCLLILIVVLFIFWAINTHMNREYFDGYLYYCGMYKTVDTCKADTNCQWISGNSVGGNSVYSYCTANP